LSAVAEAISFVARYEISPVGRNDKQRIFILVKRGNVVKNS